MQRSGATEEQRGPITVTDDGIRICFSTDGVLIVNDAGGSRTEKLNELMTSTEDP
jgi:hypothetical protein